MPPTENAPLHTLTISEAARVAQVARSTLHRAIRSGRLTLQPDGRLTVADLERSGYLATGYASGSLQAEHARLVQENAALQRERDWLREQLEMTRAQVTAALDLLRQHQDASLSRHRMQQASPQQERQETEAQLLRTLQDARPSAPRSATPNATPRSTPRPLSPNWQRILAYLDAADTPQLPRQIGEALGIPNVRTALMRMRQRGLIERDPDGGYRLGAGAT